MHLSNRARMRQAKAEAQAQAQGQADPPSLPPSLPPSFLPFLTKNFSSHTNCSAAASCASTTSESPSRGLEAAINERSAAPGDASWAPALSYIRLEAPTSAAPATMSTIPSQWCRCRRRLSSRIVSRPVCRGGRGGRGGGGRWHGHWSEGPPGLPSPARRLPPRPAHPALRPAGAPQGEAQERKRQQAPQRERHPSTCKDDERASQHLVRRCCGEEEPRVEQRRAADVAERRHSKRQRSLAQAAPGSRALVSAERRAAHRVPTCPALERKGHQAQRLAGEHAGGLEAWVEERDGAARGVGADDHGILRAARGVGPRCARLQQSIHALLM